MTFGIIDAKVSDFFIYLHPENSFRRQSDDNMRHTYNRNINDYAHYQVEQDDTLLNFLLNNVKESRSKIKATLQGRGIKVNGKTVTQFDYPVAAGTKIEVSKTKRINDKLKSR